MTILTHLLFVKVISTLVIFPGETVSFIFMIVPTTRLVPHLIFLTPCNSFFFRGEGEDLARKKEILVVRDTRLRLKKN